MTTMDEIYHGLTPLEARQQLGGMSLVYYFVGRSIERNNPQSRIETVPKAPARDGNASPNLWRVGYGYLPQIVEFCNALAAWADKGQVAVEKDREWLRQKFLEKTDTLFGTMKRIDEDFELDALLAKHLCQWKSYKKMFLQSLWESIEAEMWLGPRYKQAHWQLRRGLLKAYNDVAESEIPKLHKLHQPSSAYPRAPTKTTRSTRPMAQLVEKYHIWYHSKFQKE